MTKKVIPPSIQVWLPLLLASCTAFGMLIGHRISDETLSIDYKSADFVNDMDSKNEYYRLEEILKYIDARYVDSIDQKVLVDAATEAIFNELDPHSTYISPDFLQAVNNGMSGFYEGIGIETILHNDTLRIINIIDDSPASNSDMQYGDKILSINDSLIAGVSMPLEDQYELLRDSKKGEIDFTIESALGELKFINIIPRKIKSPNVEYYKLNDIPYINIKRFSDKTYEEIVDALEYFQKEKVIENLILDLRNNPGGYLPEATKILNQFFVEDKKLLVYTKDKFKKKSEYKTTGRPFYKIDKIAILINENSASASEIIAGALQDWDKAVIVGNKSFGKGLVQEQYNLSNGGAIRLTTARYYTPSGRFIQNHYELDSAVVKDSFYSLNLGRPLEARGGITPDINVEINENEKRIIELTRQYSNEWAFEIIYDQKWDNKDNLDLSNEDNYNIIENKIKDNINDLNYDIDEFIPAVDVLSSKIYEHLDRNIESRYYLLKYDVHLQEAIEQLSRKEFLVDKLD